MSDRPDSPSRRIARLGATLPDPEGTVYDYVPVAVHGRVAYLAGQICKVDGGLVAVGRVGAEVTLEQAQAAARACVWQGLAWLDAGAGGIDNVARILRLDCYVAAAEGFERISDVADAASGLLRAVFGPAGAHPRSVLGVSTLPRRSPVLLELTAALIEEPRGR